MPSSEYAKSIAIELRYVFLEFIEKRELRMTVQLRDQANAVIDDILIKSNSRNSPTGLPLDYEPASCNTPTY